MSKDIEKAAPSEPGKKLLELIAQLPAEDRKILKEALDKNEDKLPYSGRTITSAYFSGPVPPPNLLEAYQRINRKFADKIMAMAEKEQNHRHAMEDRTLQSITSFEKLGQLCTLLISGAIITIGALIALMADAVAGSIVVAVPLASLAAQLISGHRLKKRKYEQQ
ncbi:MAG: DUF2335 domain-containing protein [Gammaproteobacteria bacterium]|nr:DUF2335 domain-containing protein [Gammaproteobacteria bacterium]